MRQACLQGQFRDEGPRSHGGALRFDRRTGDASPRRTEHEDAAERSFVQDLPPVVGTSRSLRRGTAVRRRASCAIAECTCHRRESPGSTVPPDFTPLHSTLDRISPITIPNSLRGVAHVGTSGRRSSSSERAASAARVDETGLEANASAEGLTKPRVGRVTLCPTQLWTKRTPTNQGLEVGDSIGVACERPPVGGPRRRNLAISPVERPPVAP